MSHWVAMRHGCHAVLKLPRCRRACWVHGGRVMPLITERDVYSYIAAFLTYHTLCAAVLLPIFQFPLRPVHACWTLRQLLPLLKNCSPTSNTCHFSWKESNTSVAFASRHLPTIGPTKKLYDYPGMLFGRFRTRNEPILQHFHHDTTPNCRFWWALNTCIFRNKSSLSFICISVPLATIVERTLRGSVLY